MTDPISESFACHHVGPPPIETQPAWVATIRIVVPCADRNGVRVDVEAAAEDYIAETLRGEFLDWGYVERVSRITVSRPYREGSVTNDY